MQDIVIEKPYKFRPPHHGNWLPRCIRKTNLVEGWLKKNEAVFQSQVRHVERLRQTIDEGHSVLITPNHCRTADPLAMVYLVKAIPCLIYAMASWHLFNQGRFMAWAIPKLGGFSINREGVDRQALAMAIDVLADAARPLIVFPEGAVSGTNDVLNEMMDGTAFIARAAAKRRKKMDTPGKVFVHPVALRYVYHGDLEAGLRPILDALEARFSWQPQSQLALPDRIQHLGEMILTAKELEYFGDRQSGELASRLNNLLDRILAPLEEKWLGAVQDENVIQRIKLLRLKIVPGLIHGDLPEDERAERWRHLADIYLAQQVGSYPPDYLSGDYPRERLLEIVERFEEDLTDNVTLHGEREVIIDVGERIEVGTERDRSADSDPLMKQIQSSIGSMLAGMRSEQQATGS